VKSAPAKTQALRKTGRKGGRPTSGQLASAQQSPRKNGRMSTKQEDLVAERHQDLQDPTSEALAEAVVKDNPPGEFRDYLKYLLIQANDVLKEAGYIPNVGWRPGFAPGDRSKRSILGDLRKHKAEVKEKRPAFSGGSQKYVIVHEQKPPVPFRCKITSLKPKSKRPTNTK
jgi:hypothetical protein